MIVNVCLETVGINECTVSGIKIQITRLMFEIQERRDRSTAEGNYIETC